MDSWLAFSDLIQTAPEPFLVHMLNDPLLDEWVLDQVQGGLVMRFGWTYTNGVVYPPPVNVQK